MEIDPKAIEYIKAIAEESNFEVDGGVIEVEHLRATLTASINLNLSLVAELADLEAELATARAHDEKSLIYGRWLADRLLASQEEIEDLKIELAGFNAPVQVALTKKELKKRKKKWRGENGGTVNPT